MKDNVSVVKNSCIGQAAGVDCLTRQCPNICITPAADGLECWVLFFWLQDYCCPAEKKP